MTETSFDFISINLPNPKPRSKGVTCVTDVMWTTSMMDDYLDALSKPHPIDQRLILHRPQH